MQYAICYIFVKETVTARNVAKTPEKRLKKGWKRAENGLKTPPDWDIVSPDRAGCLQFVSKNSAYGRLSKGISGETGNDGRKDRAFIGFLQENANFGGRLQRLANINARIGDE